MASIKRSFMLVLSVILLSFPNSLNASTDFHQWCQRTTHKVTCTSIISQDPRGDLKADPSGFCYILRDKANDYAVSTLSKISDLLKGAISPEIKRLLLDANGLYADIDYKVYNLDCSILSHQKYPGLNSDLTEAIAEVAQCKSVLSKLPPDMLPLAKVNGVLGEIIETTSQILNLNECDKIQTCT